MQNWEKCFLEYFVKAKHDFEDGSHDLGHFRRVFCNASLIAVQETFPSDLLVMMAAAYFHDVVNLPKNHPERTMSSRYSAIKAKSILLEMGFPMEKIDPVCHAIETHSFSAKLQPETIEAKIIQDADRLESLGALGIMRTFYVSGRLKRSPFDPQDLHAQRRPLNDKEFGVDHFYCKLFKLHDLLQTNGGRKIGLQRTQFLHRFIDQLTMDVKKDEGGTLAVIRICYDAGQRNLQLFELEDPFAINRPLALNQFIVDQLIHEKSRFPAFIIEFLDQLKSEILK